MTTRNRARDAVDTAVKAHRNGKRCRGHRDRGELRETHQSARCAFAAELRERRRRGRTLREFLRKEGLDPWSYPTEHPIWDNEFLLSGHVVEVARGSWCSRAIFLHHGVVIVETALGSTLVC